MAYRDFTLTDLQTKLGLQIQEKALFENVPLVLPSQQLTDYLNEGKRMPLETEKAKSENVITPILRELWRNNNDFVQIFSGYKFNLDKKLKLVGFCDFMIAKNVLFKELLAPVFCMVEGKNENITNDSIGQCGAEMYAAWLFNRQKNQKTEIIYGCVSTAYDWQFLKLADNTLYIDTERYYLNNLPQLLGVFQFVVDSYR